MESGDIAQVVEIDQLSFPLPWSAAAYRYELAQNEAAHFVVALDAASEARPPWLGWLARRPTPRQVVGYSGFWYIVDEAHISTIAVHPIWRGRGVGESLLVNMLARALDLGAVAMTLEVRVSNYTAQKLYRKFWFEHVGRRKHYYRDNDEDALLMTVQLGARYRELMMARRATLRSQEST